jgi:hypothetical protein
MAGEGPPSTPFIVAGPAPAITAASTAVSGRAILEAIERLKAIQADRKIEMSHQ